MAYAVKAEVVDTRARTFTFTAQKTMYGGKRIDEGDTVFVFARQGGKVVLTNRPVERGSASLRSGPEKHSELFASVAGSEAE